MKTFTIKTVVSAIYSSGNNNNYRTMSMLY